MFVCKVLNLHGEVLESLVPADTTLEEAFLPTLKTLHERFPQLRIVVRIIYLGPSGKLLTLNVVARALYHRSRRGSRASLWAYSRRYAPFHVLFFTQIYTVCTGDTALTSWAPIISNNHRPPSLPHIP